MACSTGSSETETIMQIELDNYEIANLREGLLFLRSVGGDTGDWMGQLLMKLPESRVKPVKLCQEQKRELALKVGWGLLW